MIKIGIYDAKIEAEKRKDGVYRKVYARCPYDMDEKWRKWNYVFTLAPGMKLTRKMFYEMLAVR